MWHIAPILCTISSNVGCSIGIAENESKSLSAIDDGLEIIDLGFVGGIPRAAEDSAALLHVWGLGCPKEREMRQIDRHP